MISDVGRGKLPGLIGDGEQVWNLVPVERAAAGLVQALDGVPPAGITSWGASTGPRGSW